MAATVAASAAEKSNTIACAADQHHSDKIPLSNSISASRVEEMQLAATRSRRQSQKKSLVSHHSNEIDLNVVPQPENLMVQDISNEEDPKQAIGNQ